MFELVSLDDVREMLYFPVAEGFESTIFLTEGSNFAKIFKSYVPEKILRKKSQMVISLHFSNLEDIIPETYRLIYTKEGKFAGYFMVSLPGISLNEFCEKKSIDKKLTVLKTLQESIQTIHLENYCLTDFNPANILVQNNLTIRFVDIDSFSFMDEPSKNMFCSYKYLCPYSKTINKRYNNYSFYALSLETLFGVNKKDNKEKVIISLIKDSTDLPYEIKDKLIYFTKIRNKIDFLKLPNLFC